mgnify:FL=1
MIVCIRCGKFEDDELGWDYPSRLCPDCRKKKMLVLMKEKYAVLKAGGYKFKSAKKRGRKAYYSRMANLYFSDREKYDIYIQNTSGSKKAQITKRINERSLKNGV